MPRIAADIGFLFPEHPFLNRFAAAAKAGFKGVEYPSPYEHDKHVLAEELQRNGLTQVLHNLPRGRRKASVASRVIPTALPSFKTAWNWPSVSVTATSATGKPRGPRRR